MDTDRRVLPLWQQNSSFHCLLCVH